MEFVLRGSTWMREPSFFEVLCRMSELVRQVIDYHEISKHSFNRYAQGPGYLDWANQPDPFRRYQGAALIRLEINPPGDDPAYDLALTPGGIPPSRLSPDILSRFLLNSLAVSAWKSAGGVTWALRVNPSSGNLHPTEGYLIFGPIEGICDSPVVCHYAPKEHALELRAKFSLDLWHKLIDGFPEETILAGLSSIYWREAWKYGVRAFRYCQHDIGHALASLSIAAAGIGKQARLIDRLSATDLSSLLGLFDQGGEEHEQPECLLAVYSEKACFSPPISLPSMVIAEFRHLQWHGRPNRLSRSRVEWPDIDVASRSCQKPPALETADRAGPYYGYHETGSPASGDPEFLIREVGLCQIVRKRRSAVEMDGLTSIRSAAFYNMLFRTIAGRGRKPFLSLPWKTCAHLALFVHRIDGLPKGLYFLVRDGNKKEELQSAMHENFLWKKPADCPDGLELYILMEHDVRKSSMQLSCFQEIAGEGCFSAAMIVSFRDPLEFYGPWFYPRLFWECGMIGHILYLEAEAAGVRGTGIGCFFDDPTHEFLGLKNGYQDIYHFTVGGPVEDPRLSTLPAYEEYRV